MKAPFPWFGGKSRVSHIVWQRFGDAPNYVEPFFGSGAVLLNRPHAPRIETVNDKDCYLANFWRALQHDPAEVAHWADAPVNEADLHARHLWLIQQSDFRERMKTDPDYYDAKIAGWWVWGICCWIGSGWCDERNYSDARTAQQLPHLGNAGQGVHRPRQKRPHLLSAKGIHAGRANDLHAYFDALSERLRRVRVCCGDWTRVLGESPTTTLGLTAVFLDPPYSAAAAREGELYAVDDLSIAHDVREWAIANGNNPLLRIALCGYAGEHDMPATWEAVPWKAHGGYGSQGNGNGRANAAREVVWFSPHCLKTTRAMQAPLWAGDGDGEAQP